MRLRLFQELRALGKISGKLIGICFCTSAFGILTWVTCDGIAVVWRVSRMPPFTFPMPIMFLVWTIAYAAFGALIYINCAFKCCDSTRNSFESLVAYLISLFWCPLVFYAGTGFIALVALILSASYTVIIFFRCRRSSSIIFLLSLIIILIEIYSIYFNIGFIILN